jgi:hypothetical protein
VATRQTNVVHVAKAGDLRAARRRYREGGDEFFFAEKLGVQGMLRVADELGGLTVVNCCTEEAFEESLSPTLRAVGLGCRPSDDPEDALLGWLAQHGPRKMIARSPFVRTLAWAKQNQVDTLPVVADTFFG